MTANEGLALRLRADKNGKVVTRHLADAQLNFIMAYMAMTGLEGHDPQLPYDFGHACESLLDDLAGEATFQGLPQAFPDGERPEGPNDPRPLFQRLDDLPDSIVRAIRATVQGLALVPLEVNDRNLANDLAEKIHDFMRTLGLPTAEERQANPDAYPNVMSVRDFAKQMGLGPIQTYQPPVDPELVETDDQLGDDYEDGYGDFTAPDDLSSLTDLPPDPDSEAAA